MIGLAFVPLWFILAVAPASAQIGTNANCHQLRAKVRDVRQLLKMTKAERDDFKTFIAANEGNLNVCLGDRYERLKMFLK